MTPLDAALSSFFDATPRAAIALSLSPAVTAVRTARMWVFSSLLTALLRSVAFLFVAMRLIWLLMLAMRVLLVRRWSGGRSCGGGASTGGAEGALTTEQGALLDNELLRMAR